MKEILLIQILLELKQLSKQLKKTKIKMATTLAEFKQLLADTQTSIDAKQEQIIQQIIALKEQIANGNLVTQEDLDGLMTTVQTMKADIEETDLG